MSRYLVTFGLLGAVIAWLVLSYVDVALPTIAFSGATVLAWLPALALVLLAIFALIQFDLVLATVRMIKHPAGPVEREAVAVFNLRMGREVLLTALPLVGTLLIGLLILAN